MEHDVFPMNPIALRLSAAAVMLEGCNMPEIVAALEIAEREILRLDSELRRLTPKPPKKLVMVCGVHCQPGDATCNNYCNMAPQKGPMAKYPPPGPDSQEKSCPT